MSFPFYIYFLSFPSPSFSSEHTKSETLWNLHPWLILEMGFWPKKHILQFGAILVFLPQFFSLCFSLSPLLSSLSFSSSNHSGCLHDFFMFLGYATTFTSSFFSSSLVFSVTQRFSKLYQGVDFALAIQVWPELNSFVYKS